ncbi:MAG: hypothetical protein KIT11_00205 [Fimbriimonadaceae bacterium]|nr:hypothetical protein [Fimbriimonadaceae bacterium]QYK55204.1 MAG: hypothetical protein KF733_09330 [Fimbriimonadaceae bacterium]
MKHVLKPLALSALTASLALAGFAFGRSLSEKTDALGAGDPVNAEAVARAIALQLRANGNQPVRLPRGLTLLADQKLASDREDRDNPVSFCTPRPDHPVLGELAAYTNLYIRSNFQRGEGDEGWTNPEGFYVIAWRDGRVERVPFGTERYVWAYEGEARLYTVFPGMTAYANAVDRATALAGPPSPPPQ